MITRAKRILAVTRQSAGFDALASLSALISFFSKQGKTIEAVAPGVDSKTAPSFLPRINEIKSDMGAVRAFRLKLDVTRVPLSELMYDVKDNHLEITIVPKSGEWSPKDVSFRHGDDRYDLVIAVDCPDLNSLGQLFQNHADFFYRMPVITIDSDPEHEYWGQINLVDLTAVSTTEILFDLFEHWKKDHIDEDVATALLAGMIIKTQSFKTSNITPKTLQTASKLIAAGAKREKIVHSLWRTRTVPILKLWGKALYRLEQDHTLNLVWTSLCRQDFLEAGVDEKALQGIVDELVAYAPEAKIMVLAYEGIKDNRHRVFITIHTTPPFSALDLGRPHGATGSRDRVDFCLPEDIDLISGMKNVIEGIKKLLKDRQTNAW